MSIENRPWWRVLSCRAGLVLLALATCVGAASPAGHGGPIRAVAAGLGLVVSGGFDGMAIVWPVGLILRGHESGVNAVAVMDDGAVVTGGADGKILIWNDAMQSAAYAAHGGPVAGLAVSDNRIASASWDGTARIWAVDGASQVLRGHDGPVNAVAFAPGGRVVTGGYDGTVRIWADDGTAGIHRLGSPVNAVAVAGDDEIVAGGADGVLRLLVGDRVRSLALDTTPITGLALSADGTRVAVVSLGGAAMVVDRSRLVVTTVFLGAEQPLWAVAFGGETVVTGGAAGVVRRWDALTGRAVDVFGTAPVADLLPVGDRGAAVFRACAACHSLQSDDRGRAGPSLHGLFGRRAGTLPGYAYSPSLIGLDLVWSPATVSDLFDRGPQAVTPGTKMPEQRIENRDDREALMRFLERATR